MEENKSKKVITLMVLCVSIIALTVSLSYAYFASVSGSNVNQDLSIKSGTISLTFRDNSASLNPKLNGTWTLGDTVEKELIIENTGTLPAIARIYWDDFLNTYMLGSLTYTLEESKNYEGPYTEIIKDKNVPRSTESSTKALDTILKLDAKTTYYYKLTIKFNDLDVDQSEDINATLAAKFSLGESTDKIQVTFNNGDSTEDLTVTYKNTFGTLPTPTKKGYNFIG